MRISGKYLPAGLSLNERFGTVFAPFLRETFNELAQYDDFWENIDQSSFHDLLFLSMDNDYYELEQHDLDELALLFARVVDYKSLWTTTHSQTVSALACRIGELMELSPDVCFELKIAGYLHDVGKVGIATELLDKPGKLDEREFKLIKSHALYSSLILSSIKGLENISRWAVNHHEKRDGSGYPLKLSGEHFTEEMDIVAYADIFSAIAEDRPYRKGLNKDKVVAELGKYPPDRLSEKIFCIIRENIDELYAIHNRVHQCDAFAI